MKLFYLGPNGSFSSLAADHLSSKHETYEPSPSESWQAIWQALENTNDAAAVIPIENSITSNVHANMDVLFEKKFIILEELFLNIQLSLFATKGTVINEVKDIYSHPQALAQANDLIKEYKWTPHETTSTTAALQLLKKLNAPTAAALAPSLINEEREGLARLIEKAQNVDQNQTRFVVVSDTQPAEQTGDKATLIIEAAHKVGSLGKLLQDFSAHNFNLTKIESRPIPGKNWVYQFWIDIVLPAPVTSIELSKTLASIEHIESYYVLGIYDHGTVI